MGDVAIVPQICFICYSTLRKALQISDRGKNSKGQNQRFSIVDEIDTSTKQCIIDFNESRIAYIDEHHPI